MYFILSAWGRIDGLGAFIKNAFMPASPWKQKLRAPRRGPGLAGALSETCALPSTVVGRLGNRSERSPLGFNFF
jgi:hypothetical protein